MLIEALSEGLVCMNRLGLRRHLGALQFNCNGGDHEWETVYGGVQERLALTGFTASIEALKASGVIRSHRYLGDIAGYLSADAYVRT